jgi:hypothetical protein
LILTKGDLLREKIIEYGHERIIMIMKRIWTTYNGNGSFDDVVTFIRQQFHQLSDNNEMLRASHDVRYRAHPLQSYVIDSSFDGPSVLSVFQSILEHYALNAAD